MVGCCNDNAVGVIVFDELQEGIQHAPNFTDLVARGSIRSERIELVEQVHRPCFADGVEDQPQLRSSLTEISRRRLGAREQKKRIRDIPGYTEICRDIVGCAPGVSAQ